MKKIIGVLLLSFLAAGVSAEESADNPAPKISISGTGYIMFGQVANGHAFGKMGDSPLMHHWMNFYSGRINAMSEPNDWFTARICAEVASSFPILRQTTIMKNIFKTNQRSFLPQASGLFHFAINEQVPIEIEGGLMEYAFNTEVKNLGNYMYRSTAYPFNVRTKLDYIYSSIAGVRLQSGFINNQLKVGAIMNTIVDLPPFFDWNLGFYGSFNTPNKLIDAGVGVVFERLFSVHDSSTDCISQKRSLGDTTVTMRGTKIDARLTFDVKQLFGGSSIFGPNDAKIYVEGALLGTKDPDFYFYETDTLIPKPNLLNRMPVMLGVNIPTFKILDILSVELEYCKYPYPFDWWGALPVPSPKPNFPTQSKDSTWRDNYVSKDNLKWSFYLKKSISKFDIIGFIANDHVLYETFDAESQMFTEQSLREPKNWHWYIKLQYNL